MAAHQVPLSLGFSRQGHWSGLPFPSPRNVKWALESITTNKASGGDGIPVELFQILRDDALMGQGTGAVLDLPNRPTLLWPWGP